MYSSITSPITPSGTGTGATLSIDDAEGAAADAEGGAVQCSVVEKEGVLTVQCEEGSDEP